MAARRLIAALAACLVALAAGYAQALDSGPPETRIDPVVETFHGEFVEDPYRWLEDTASSDVRAWFEAQNAYARTILDAVPGRAALRDELARAMAATASVESTMRAGDRIFSLKRDPGDPHHRLVVRQGIDGAERVVVDPARWRTSTSTAAIDYYAPAPNGRRVAVAVSLGGSESSTLHVIDVETGAEIGEPIPRTDFGAVSWRFDSAVMFYQQGRELPPGADPADKYRDIVARMREFRDDAVAGDAPVMGRSVGAGLPIAPDDIPAVVVSPVSSWALGIVQHGVAREKTVFVAPLVSLRGPDTPWRKVVDRARGVEDVAMRGEWLYLRTNEGAPRYRLMRWSLRQPGAYRADAADEVLPQGKSVLAAFGIAKDAVYVHDRDAGTARLRRLDFVVKQAPAARAPRGKAAAPAAKPAGVARIAEVKLPFAGSIEDFVVDPLIPGALLQLEGWTEPPGYFAVAPSTGAIARTTIQPRSPVSLGDLVVVDTEAKSHDGVAVPLTILSRRGAPRDGTAPALVLAYGAYGYPYEPAFSPSLKPWFDRGGVVAIAHVRGGGEGGRDWHLAGRQATKPNSWLDLVACAEALAAGRWASRDRLATRGGSAGGLTVVNAMEARPDLFRAVVSEVGFHDAIRGEVVASGPANVEEFGTVATPEGFRGLVAMSAYGNARDGVAYPAVLLTAGYNDPRVEPWDPGKMAARLQAIAAGPGGSGRPVLLRTEFDGGHGVTATLRQRIDVATDIAAFLLWQLGVPGYAPLAATPAAKD